MWATTLHIALLFTVQYFGSAFAATPVSSRADHSGIYDHADYIASLHTVRVFRRQEPSAVQNFTTAEWDSDTSAACLSAMQALDGKSNNPSGLGVCYNVNFLDNETGQFEAELRLYTIEAPTGDFATPGAGNVNVSLEYVGATATAANITSKITRRSLGVKAIEDLRGSIFPRQSLTELMMQQFVGKIDAELLPNIDETAEQKLLTPLVTLSRILANGTTINTTLTSAQSSFVNGVFSQEAQVIPNATYDPPLQTLVVADGETFVLPGVTIMIFPIGAVITGVWALLFTATVAYGTRGRMQFREIYRRRKAMLEKKNVARI